MYHLQLRLQEKYQNGLMVLFIGTCWIYFSITSSKRQYFKIYSIYLRNGPGRYEFGSLNYKHLFDGQACIHKYAIKDGEVNYSNKLLESKAYTKTINENRLFPAFGTADSKANIIQRVRSFFNPPDHLDNCNVSVLPLGKDQLYALTETTRVLRLEPSNLKIINSTNLSDYIPDIRTSLAHPHIEKNGDWINVGICIKKGKPFYTVVKYKGTAQNNLCDHAKVIAEVPSSHEGGFGYYHSFAVIINLMYSTRQAHF